MVYGKIRRYDRMRTRSVIVLEMVKIVARGRKILDDDVGGVRMCVSDED